MPTNHKKQQISIVIPAFNEEHHLSRVLKAIKRQTIRPLAVFVIDNNSTDRTAAIAAAFPFVTVLQESRQGIVYARNRGFQAAVAGGCDIIARLDADSLLPPHWLERVADFYAPLHSSGSNLSDRPGGQGQLTRPALAMTALTGGCYFYNLHSGVLVGKLYDFTIHRLNQLLLGYAFPWGSNTALPASLWQAVSTDTCHDTAVHEDLDLGIHIHQHGGQTIYKPRLRVGAVARRIRSDRGDLWLYLRMWPASLQRHHIKSWPLALLFAIGIWVGSYIILAVEWLLDLVGYEPVHL